MENISFAPWRSPLSRALHRNRSEAHSRYFQLATVTKEGNPANRTVVFRGFMPNSNWLQIGTDSRSEKIEQIEHQPRGEVCWYFTKTREQFRLTGKLTIIGANSSNPVFEKARQALWQQLSDSAREQFGWPDPRQPKADEISPSFSEPVSDKEPLPNFCLLLLDPIRVDHLELRGEPQNRCLYILDPDARTWSTRLVNP